MASSFIQDAALASGHRAETLSSIPTTSPHTPSPVPFQWPLQKTQLQTSCRALLSRKPCNHEFPSCTSSDRQCLCDRSQRKQSQLHCPRCQHARCGYCQDQNQEPSPCSRKTTVQLRNPLRSPGSSFPQRIQRRSNLRSKRPRSLSKISAVSASSLSVPASGASTRASDASMSGWSASPSPSVSSFTSQGTSLLSGSGSGSSGGTPDGHWMSWDPIAQELQQKLEKVKDERNQVLRHLETIEQRMESLRRKLGAKEQQEEEEMM